MGPVKPFMLNEGQALRSSTWRRLPLHRWRGRQMDTTTLIRKLAADATAKRRRAICRLMDEHGVANTERAHRQAYARIWTDRVRGRVGLPPRPDTLVRWRTRLGSGERRLGVSQPTAAVECCE